MRLKYILNAIFTLGLVFTSIAQAQENKTEGEEGELWFSRVQQIIKTHHVRSTSQLLEVLPAELRSRYILIFFSRSLQQAGYLNPRVLLISPGSTFILTFNGDETQAGFEAIETMRYTEKNGRPEFIFEEIAMPADQLKRARWLESQGRSSQSIFKRELRSGPNAVICLNCHRADPRPNWDHYSFWPGVYGQLDSQLYTRNPSVREQDPTSGEYLKVDNTKAADGLPEFIKIASAHPRYRHLIKLEEFAKVRNGYMSRQENKILFNFTSELSRLNFRRIGYLLNASPKALQNTYNFLLGVTGCSIPEAKTAESLDGEYADSVFNRLELLFKDSSFRWKDFFMNFATGSGNNFTTPGYFLPEMLYEMNSYNEALEPFLGPVTSDLYGIRRHLKSSIEGKNICEVLQDKVAELKQNNEVLK